MDGGSLSRLTVNCDGPFVVLHDAIDHRQPETGAFAGGFGGEERIEDSCQR